MALAFITFVQNRGLDDEGSSFWFHCPFPPPHTNVLHFGVCQGPGTSGQNGQNAAERCLGTGGPSGSRALQLAVSSAEGVGVG